MTKKAKRVGRPALAKGVKRAAVAFALPPDLIRDIKAAAKAREISRSQLVADGMRYYLDATEEKLI